ILPSQHPSLSWYVVSRVSASNRNSPSPMHAGGDALARSDVLTGEVVCQPELAQVERRVPDALDKGLPPGDLRHLPRAPQLLRRAKTLVQRCRRESRK